MEFSNFKSGFVSIIGKPNVGKSTLLNKFIGEKLSIISPKPQTTRSNIKGIYNTTDAQIIFIDTPGFLEPRYELQEKMLSYIIESIKNSDLLIYVCDASDFPSEYDDKVLNIIKKSKQQCICIINKTDLISSSQITILKDKLLSSELDIFNNDNLFFCSALSEKVYADNQQQNINVILQKIITYLPYNPPLYDQENLSDLPMRFFAQEIIREKIFLYYDKEIPYSTTVVVEKWSEEENRDVIQATIWIERDSQKPIIIGKQGKMIGKVRQESEMDISTLTGKKAVLNLWVKVKYDWRKKNGALHEFGYK
ncbi:MAG: GTPase Era [Candidatus Cloacimonetes bacterium]|nr:GTPase Era [Candidatus Cloacimonadota bacterium]MDD4155950.1 GTPase Era [Candidatus Cloacimonadota bacterium]